MILKEITETNLVDKKSLGKFGCQHFEVFYDIPKKIKQNYELKNQFIPNFLTKFEYMRGVSIENSKKKSI